jgi:hypothetical protein
MKLGRAAEICKEFQARQIHDQWMVTSGCCTGVGNTLKEAIKDCAEQVLAMHQEAITELCRGYQ